MIYKTISIDLFAKIYISIKQRLLYTTSYLKPNVKYTNKKKKFFN